MQRTHRLPLEVLEPRTLFATFVVTNPDDGGPGSLREAVAQANALPGLDEIVLQVDTTLTTAGAAQDATSQRTWT